MPKESWRMESSVVKMKIFIFKGAINWDAEQIITGIYELNETQIKELTKFAWKNYTEDMNKKEIRDLRKEVKEDYEGETIKYFIGEGSFCDRWFRLHKNLPKLIKKWKLICKCDGWIF